MRKDFVPILGAAGPIPPPPAKAQAKPLHLRAGPYKHTDDKEYARVYHDVIVIGEGVSGLSAAGALAQAGLKVATIEAQLFGGLIINVNELDPVPEGQPTSGAELAAELMQANAEAGITSIQEPVTLVRNNGDQKEIVTGVRVLSGPTRHRRLRRTPEKAGCSGRG
jgi:alkyl hydroperoxide reductase subunit AhpF